MRAMRPDERAKRNSMMGEMMAARKGSSGVEFERREVGAEMEVNTESYAHILKPYAGDIFGSRGKSEDGMIYLSRMTADPFKGDGRGSKRSVVAEQTTHGMHPGRRPSLSANNVDEAAQTKTRSNYAKALCSLSWQNLKVRRRIVQKGR